MNRKIIESVKVKKTRIAHANAAYSHAPFYSAYFPYSAQAVSLFWSVFGPAARYGFINPDTAYAASMKP